MFRLESLKSPSLIVLGALTVLSGCTSINLQTTADKKHSTPMNSEELVEYIDEWKATLQKVERLAVLEDDLALIIAEVGKNTQLNDSPSQYANYVQTDVYQNEDAKAVTEPHVTENQSADNDLIEATEQQKSKSAHAAEIPVAEANDKLPTEAKTKPIEGQLYAVHLAYFLKPQRAESQWKVLKQQYPALFNKLTPMIEHTNNNQQILYSLKLGPLDSAKTALLLCDFFAQQKYRCQPTRIADGTI